MRVRGRPLYAPEQPRAHPLGALTTPPRRPSVVRPGHNVVISRSGGRSLGSRAARHQHRDEPRRRPWPDQLAENFFARWDGATARPGAANGAHRLQQSARHCCTRLDPSWLPAARRSRRLSEPAGALRRRRSMQGPHCVCRCVLPLARALSRRFLTTGIHGSRRVDALLSLCLGLGRIWARLSG